MDSIVDTVTRYRFRCDIGFVLSRSCYHNFVVNHGESDDLSRNRKRNRQEGKYWSGGKVSQQWSNRSGCMTEPTRDPDNLTLKHHGQGKKQTHTHTHTHTHTPRARINDRRVNVSLWCSRFQPVARWHFYQRVLIARQKEVRSAVCNPCSDLQAGKIERVFGVKELLKYTQTWRTVEIFCRMTH